MKNNEHKQWWAPVWTGLVVDQGGKHCRKMKTSVWLFLYLVLHANRRTGLLMRKVRTISKDMGITRDTTIRWLKVLRAEGYIATLNTGRYLTIQVKNWKAFQVLAGSNSRTGNNPIPAVGNIQHHLHRHFRRFPTILARNRAFWQRLGQRRGATRAPLQGPRPEPGPGYHLALLPPCSGIGTKAINLRGRNAATVLQDAIFNPLTRTSWIPFHAEPRQYLYANEAVSRLARSVTGRIGLRKAA